MIRWLGDIMKNYSFIDIIEFAIKYQKSVQVISRNNKMFWAKIYDFDGKLIKWNFSEKQILNENDFNYIYISNVKRMILNSCDEIEFAKFIKCRNLGIDDYKSLEDNVNMLFSYYQTILDNNLKELKSKETLDKEQIIEKNTLENKIKLLDTILENLFESADNLLFPFVTGAKFNNDVFNAEDRPILLLSNSNASQKCAIENALTEKVSFIEGPPGTGKTTTILSIIANLLYRNKKIVVVSKNNSAINNIGEELDKLNLPKIYVRLGNSKYTDELFETVLNDLYNYQREIEKIDTSKEIDIAKFNSEYNTIKEKELELNEIVKKKNELEEFKTQKRHNEKKENAFCESFSGKMPFWIKFLNLEQLAQMICKISNKIEKYNGNDNKISFIDKVVAFLFWKIKSNDFFKQYLLLKWEFESIYLDKKILEVEDCIKNSDYDNLKKEINDLYSESYWKMSIELFKNSLSKYFHKSDFQFENLVNTVTKFKEKHKNEFNDDSYSPEYLKEKSRLIKEITDFFPLTLTTTDSLPNNFYSYRNGDAKFDYVIIDEATQCDVISGIATLFYAKNCVISGDSKQLSAITGEDFDIDESNIPENLRFFNNDFLSATRSTFDVEPVLLKEHYRCDYNIINYCNRFFYDNELIIYRNANTDAMKLVDVKKGKYADYEKFSFCNDREVYSISDLCDGDLSHSFVITPFKGQKALLKKEFTDYKNNCGTIHSFQGRGKGNVYFSTVLNDLSVCNKHLASSHNLFTPELVNVAVSRAKDRFVLVTDKEYFLNHSPLIKNLILYIDKYGEEIPDKTVCLFDYLYRQMPTYVEIKNCSNPFELTMFETLEEFCNIHKEFSVLAKLPLAELVTDKDYLNTHNQIRDFVLNERTHIDFTIINVLENPVLAIELDGKHHKEAAQKRRDNLKNSALRHMGIELLRISSKAAFSKTELIKQIEDIIYKEGTNN